MHSDCLKCYTVKPIVPRRWGRWRGRGKGTGLSSVPRSFSLNCLKCYTETSEDGHHNSDYQNHRSTHGSPVYV